MQREGRATLMNWALAVGSENKWPVLVDFDPRRSLLIVKPVLAGMC